MIRKRYRRIVLFFGKMVLSFVIWDLILPKIGLKGWAGRTRSDRYRKSSRAFRSLAIELGGVLIKVGQFLSSRVDVMPAEITDELAGLQDEVPAEDFADIRWVIENEFGLPLPDKFSQFEVKPLAAASLGQVHRAVLVTPAVIDGDKQLIDVVVKVQRPNIENIIATDMSALETVGGWLQAYRPIRRRANIPELLNEFKRILYQEIDYLAEGRNAETFAANFSGDSRVYVPEVVWTHTTKRVLTLENVWNVKISDYPAITDAGVDRKEVASRLLDTYLKQIFEDGFFHADPHPGNLFIHPLGAHSRKTKSQHEWTLVFVDFGMVGRITPAAKTGLREMLIAVGTKDAARLVRAYQTLGILLPGADLEMLERAGMAAFDRFWGKDMSELQQVSLSEMRQFAHEFRQLLYTMPFQVPQDFIYLVRAVGILSGICTGLDPQFNVWDHLAPFARKIISQEASSNLDVWLEEIGRFSRTVLTLPYRLDSLISRIDRGEVNIRTPDVKKQLARIDASIRQATVSFIFAGLLVSGVMLFLADYITAGAIILAFASFCFFWLLISMARR